jgi:hypothetical protein
MFMVSAKESTQPRVELLICWMGDRMVVTSICSTAPSTPPIFF